MGLIKAETSPVVVAFKWRDIEGEVRKRLDEAQQKSEAMLAEAHAAADSIREAARDEGYRAGYEQGLSEGHGEGQNRAINDHVEQLEVSLGALRQAVNAVTETKHQLRADAISEMVELSIAIARRVIKRQAMFDPQVLIANLRESVALAAHTRQLRIAIHPSQHRVLMEALPRLEIEFPALGRAHFVEDAGVAAGGCRVYTEHGQIDADLESQIDRVVDGLIGPSAQEQAA